MALGIITAGREKGYVTVFGRVPAEVLFGTGGKGIQRAITAFVR